MTIDPVEEAEELSIWDPPTKESAPVGHTPGPWNAHKGTGGDPERCYVTQDAPLPYMIAEVENGAPGDTLETEWANALLIAAAPDLLAACSILDGLDWCPGYELSQVERLEEALKAARAAIAKATGSQQ